MMAFFGLFYLVDSSRPDLDVFLLGERGCLHLEWMVCHLVKSYIIPGKHMYLKLAIRYLVA